MALTLFNGKLALSDLESFSGNADTMTGKVVMLAQGVTGVVAGDRVIYPKALARPVVYGGKEYVIVKFAELDGKL